MNLRPVSRAVAVSLSVVLAESSLHAAFHLWQVKEVFSNADGSVQFIELFNSFSGENFVAGHTIVSNSDGVIKNFTLSSNLSSSATANRHLLIATPGFGDLPGGVTPDYTLPDPITSGPFFNPSAANISIRFDGSNDTMMFSSATLPKDGVNSLTDTGATGFPPGTPNIVTGVNSPTNFAGNSGSVNLAPPATTGDYNGNGVVDAADYVVWRDTLTEAANPAGSGADGDGDGTIGQGDYDYWLARFGITVPAAGADSHVTSVPEPSAVVLMSWVLSVFARRDLH